MMFGRTAVNLAALKVGCRFKELMRFDKFLNIKMPFFCIVIFSNNSNRCYWIVGPVSRCNRLKVKLIMFLWRSITHNQ